MDNLDLALTEWFEAEYTARSFEGRLGNQQDREAKQLLVEHAARQRVRLVHMIEQTVGCCS